ncbi:hypothetical protein [Embleya sp. NPDC005971]|uniref:hypothetical protein n=1 Tax=Embleya sp. NPDC005971 TaxID=3156724 RepID=UPI0033FC524E
MPSQDILLKVVGLSEVATLAATGAAVPVDEIAADLEHLCAAPTPQAQDRILPDADLAAGTDVPMGPYTLRTLTAEQLRRVHPLPFLRPRTLNPGESDGSAFLVLPRPNRRLGRAGLRLSLDIRPVLEHVKALALLLLWRDEPLHAEAIFHVEPGRCVRTNMFLNTYNTRIRTDHEGNEVGEAHDRGYFKVRNTEIAEFTAFCARVWDMMDAVAPEDAQTTEVEGRKRRFRRAMDHLVLATAGTHGPGHVDPHEADELLLRPRHWLGGLSSPAAERWNHVPEPGDRGRPDRVDHPRGVDAAERCHGPRDRDAGGCDAVTAVRSTAHSGPRSLCAAEQACLETELGVSGGYRTPATPHAPPTRPSR